EMNKIKSTGKISIIDANVFDKNHTNVALPKSDFAELVLNNAPNFDDFDFSEFEKIFDIIDQIAENNA
ncbi:MAG: RNA-directed DNA polymerase, partial [Roseiflexaceae bacterium]